MSFFYNKIEVKDMDIKNVLEKVKKEMNLSDDVVSKIAKVVGDNLTDKDGIIKNLISKVNLSEADAKKIYEKIKSALASEAGKKITSKVMDFFNKKK